MKKEERANIAVSAFCCNRIGDLDCTAFCPALSRQHMMVVSELSWHTPHTRARHTLELSLPCSVGPLRCLPARPSAESHII